MSLSVSDTSPFSERASGGADDHASGRAAGRRRRLSIVGVSVVIGGVSGTAVAALLGNAFPGAGLLTLAFAAVFALVTAAASAAIAFGGVSRAEPVGGLVDRPAFPDETATVLL